jgi:uncharacterized membrane protein
MKPKKIILPDTLVNHHSNIIESELDQTSQNIEAVLDFYTREEQKISSSQRMLERISNLIGQPFFLGIIMLFVASWLSASVLFHKFGIAEFDPAPFHFLQGVIALGALLTATIVLIKQNRLAKLEERRSHLDLKVMLLTEHKAAKLIQLIEELRQDLPNVKNRNDDEATTLKQSISPEVVIATLDEGERSLNQEYLSENDTKRQIIGNIKK